MTDEVQTHRVRNRSLELKRRSRRLSRSSSDSSSRESSRDNHYQSVSRTRNDRSTSSSDIANNGEPSRSLSRSSTHIRRRRRSRTYSASVPRSSSAEKYSNKQMKRPKQHSSGLNRIGNGHFSDVRMQGRTLATAIRRCRYSVGHASSSNPVNSANGIILLCWNLPQDAEKGMLQELFSDHAKVINIDMPLEIHKASGSASAKGYAIVTIDGSDASSALQARSHLNGSLVKGRDIKVDFAIKVTDD